MNTDTSARNRRVLIIDDNAAIHADFRKILGERDADVQNSNLDRAESDFFGDSTTGAPVRQTFEITSAMQGRDGLTAVQEAVKAGRPFALAFVDVRMPPGWDGVETTARLWEADPDLQIVICTAYSDYSWDEMCARLGTPDRMVILKKPFDAVEVLQLANSMSEKWWLLQQARLRLKDLEQAVAERTQELRVANERLRAEVREHESTERVLRSIQEKLNHFLTKSPTVLYSLRVQKEQSSPAWISDNFTRLTGYPVESWYQQISGLDFVEPGDRAVVQENLNTLLRQNAASVQYRIRRHDGASRWVRDDQQLLRDEEGQPVEIIGCLSDITDQRMLEEELRQAQKLESVGVLAGGVAHDFNNLLTVIRGHVELLLNGEGIPGPTSEALKRVLGAADRAANLTRQLLAFSRKQFMRPEKLDLSETVVTMMKLLASTLGERITLTSDCAPGLPVVHADRGMIEQVIVNLAVNARDAMPKGGELKISTSACEIEAGTRHPNGEARPGSFVCLSIADSGVGISPENLPHIFEPFFTTKEVGKGTGLGLATVYGIIKQHEGWVQVESAPGKGTEFRIFLPACSGRAAAAKATASGSARPATGKETILVVEDEAALCGLIRTTLQRHGYRVFTAASGTEALSAWSAKMPQVDLLLTDMVMPGGVTGTELVKEMRAKNPELKAICMSGYSSEINGHQNNGTSEIPFLVKPFGTQMLAELVRSCLDDVTNQTTTHNPVCIPA